MPRDSTADEVGMGFTVTDLAPGARGRVVMLVDNGVDGDSRVQKMAKSAAEAGWQVTLLGRSADGQQREWRLGGAAVCLLPMTSDLSRRPHQFRRAWIRWPLAYPPNGIAAHRAHRLRARKADLAARAAALTLGTGWTARRRQRERWALGARQFTLALSGRWVWLRTKMLNRAQYARRFRNPWDLAYTWFWRLIMGERSWRRLEPGLWDYELAYGPVIDELAPDLIHAHDFRMLGVGARAALRARAAGRSVKLVWDAHEYLPGLQPWQDNARWLPGNCAHEREYAPYADAVITVSEALADLLVRRHNLVTRPRVVLNAPDVSRDGTHVDGTSADEPPPQLRERCEIGPDTALLVYSGVAAHKRGLGVMVEALVRLDDVHVAFVVNQPAGPYMSRLLARAAELGVADRVHTFGYVPHWQVVSFLSSADAGVIPIQHWPNHEIALITKFFEYSHAGLPIIVSDVRMMAETVKATGQGEVFVASSVDDYVRAVRAVLAEPSRYRRAYQRPDLLAQWTWKAQARALDEVYRGLLGDPSATNAGMRV